MSDNQETVILSFDDLAEMGKGDGQMSKNNQGKNVVEYTLEGSFLNVYDSCHQASQALGISASFISAVCTGRNLLYSGEKTNSPRIFLYRGEEDINDRLEKIDVLRKAKTIHLKSEGKEVYEYSLGGKFLYKWSTMTLAAKAYNTTARVILRCCKGKVLFLDKRIFLFPDGDIKQRLKLVKAELYRLSTKRPKFREVDEYTLDGKFVKAYPSASAVSRELHIHVSNITRCCNEGDKYHYCLTCKDRIFLWVGASISERLELIKQKNNNNKQ